MSDVEVFGAQQVVLVDAGTTQPVALVEADIAQQVVLVEVSLSQGPPGAQGPAGPELPPPTPEQVGMAAFVRDYGSGPVWDESFATPADIHGSDYRPNDLQATEIVAGPNGEMVMVATPGIDERLYFNRPDLGTYWKWNYATTAIEYHYDLADAAPLFSVGTTGDGYFKGSLAVRNVTANYVAVNSLDAASLVSTPLIRFQQSPDLTLQALAGTQRLSYASGVTEFFGVTPQGLVYGLPNSIYLASAATWSQLSLDEPAGDRFQLNRTTHQLIWQAQETTVFSLDKTGNAHFAGALTVGPSGVAAGTPVGEIWGSLVGVGTGDVADNHNRRIYMNSSANGANITFDQIAGNYFRQDWATGLFSWFMNTVPVLTMDGVGNMALRKGALTIDHGPTPFPAYDADSLLQLVGNTGRGVRIEMEAFGPGVATAIFAKTANGTAAAPTPTKAGDAMFVLGAGGRGATAFTIARGQIRIAATADWSDTSHPTQIVFSTTALNSVAQVDRWRINHDGALSPLRPDGYRRGREPGRKRHFEP